MHRMMEFPYLDHGIIEYHVWRSNLRSSFWQMHSLDKIAQQLAQLLGSQCWDIQLFLGEIMSMADCSHGKNFSTCIMC